MQPFSADQLIALFTSQLKLTRELNALLLKEREQLGKNLIDDFEHTVEQKIQTLNTLAGIDHQINALIANSPLAGKRIAEIIEQFTGTNSVELRNLWAELLQAVSECSQANTINSQIVAGCIQQTKQAVDILTGKLPNDTTLYGASGKTIEPPLSSTHIKV